MRASLSSALRAFLLISVASFAAQGVTSEMAFRAELNLRIKNSDSSLQSATLCGFRPLALNGKQYVWEVLDRASGRSLEGSPFCKEDVVVGPHQSLFSSFVWSVQSIDELETGNFANYSLDELASTELANLAHSFQQYPPEQRLEKIFEWMHTNIAFSGIRTQAEGAEHALRTRSGDCTEHMLLAGELLQRNGFTVRRVLGFSMPQDRKLVTSSSLHNWIEYRENARWLIFDSSYRVLGEPAERNYISVLYYQNSQQLDIMPFWSDVSELKFYLR